MVWVKENSKKKMMTVKGSEEELIIKAETLIKF